jgi:glycosyltransferase involved in cell wall biosynthesis
LKSRRRARVTFASIVQKKRKAVCIITFSPVARDVRVLRQIQYLSRRYDVTAIGEGRAHPMWSSMEGVRWVPTLPIGPEAAARRLARKAIGLSMLLAGRLYPPLFERWYWRQPIMKDTLAKAVASGADALHANDWNTLPIAVEAAKKLGGRVVVFDAHEYGPLELADRLGWRVAYSAMIRRLLRRYAPAADASLTVAPAIAERYKRELGIDPLVLMNAPANTGPPPQEAAAFDPEDIRLVYHGGAIPNRGLEAMIRTLALCERRYTLHLLLVGDDLAYIRRLKALAEELTPGRVTFHDPVPPEEIIGHIASYQVGFCFVAPTNYNNLVCLPNKFFDFIAAGLPVCIGPSPSMIEIADSYGFACVAASFEPRDLAAALNGLSAARLAEMRAAARRAAGEINADREMGKLVEVYERLLGE